MNMIESCKGILASFIHCPYFRCPIKIICVILFQINMFLLILELKMVGLRWVGAYIEDKGPYYFN